MPPVPLPRRMFAGGRMRFLAPLRIGAPARLERTIRAITEKTGRTGRLVFTTVAIRVSQDGATCIEEEQDIVYRGHGEPLPAPGVLPPEPLPAGDFGVTVNPEAALLFRFSALTWNAHRIHYDRDYCTQVEGYPGVIVHGPLQAVLLAGLAMDHAGAPLAGFEFRSEAPIFDLAPFQARGRRDADALVLETRRSDGVTAMRATARTA
jgi:3-methylfumaryl-CoA hydratase